MLSKTCRRRPTLRVCSFVWKPSFDKLCCIVLDPGFPVIKTEIHELAELINDFLYRVVFDCYWNRFFTSCFQVFPEFLYTLHCSLLIIFWVVWYDCFEDFLWTQWVVFGGKISDGCIDFSLHVSIALLQGGIELCNWFVYLFLEPVEEPFNKPNHPLLGLSNLPPECLFFHSPLGNLVMHIFG